jgi:hypothetical protein
MTTVPALVGNGRADILSANRLGYALFSEVFADPVRPANNARYVFLNPKASDFLVDWDQAADDVVASLRAEAGRDPYDRRLTDLIVELSTRSDDFRVRWAAHNVRFHRTGTKAASPQPRRRAHSQLRGLSSAGGRGSDDDRLHG